MRTIIAGGRRYVFTLKDVEWLDSLLVLLPITEVVSGGARGADEWGEYWAKSHGMSPKVMRARWDDLAAPNARIQTSISGHQYNANAGFDRNESMARYAQAAILFPGGPGTRDMLARAVAHGLKVYRQP